MTGTLPDLIEYLSRRPLICAEEISVNLSQNVARLPVSVVEDRITLHVW